MTRLIQRAFFLFLMVAIMPLGFHAKDKDKDKKKESNISSFVGFSGTASFLNNDAKYFDFSFGIKAKCKYKIGLNYGWLAGGYETSDYPVDTDIYPNATTITKTNLKLYSVLFEPLLIRDKVINISIPFHVGITELESRFKRPDNWYELYHTSNPWFASAAMNMDLKVFAFLKIGLKLGYRYVYSDFEVAQNDLSTPFIAFGVKIGKMCK